MQTMSQRLDELAARVAHQASGAPASATTNDGDEGVALPTATSTPAQVSHPAGGRNWANISPAERLSSAEYNATLTWPEEDVEESYGRCRRALQKP